MRKALTIGELLVTMAIIGTIAMLVLPGFMKDYHKRLYTSKLKKSIELITQAINLACTDNNVSYFYQTPYVADTQGFMNKYFKTTNNAGSSFAQQYISVDKANTITPGAGFKLGSGEAMAFFCSNGTCTFVIDVNATDGPNVGGRDLFTINLDPKENRLFENGGACTSSAQGIGCYNRLVQDNWTMNY